MGNLNGKKALVTAGGQGIGRAIAEELVRSGCDVVVSYYSSRAGAEELAAFAQSHGRRATGFQADLTKAENSDRLLKEAGEFLGGLDVLVNNAGDLVGRRQLTEIDAEFWQKVMSINLDSLLAVTRAAAPLLTAAGAKEGASIVNLASLAGRKGGHPGSLAYSASKGAVLTWTRALANELGPRGVRVNAVAPGLILGTSFHATHTTEESARQTVAGIPLGRAGSPEDVARTVRFLAGEYDGFITGATIDINGGVYCA